MPNMIKAICPHCGKEAVTRLQVLTRFGFRCGGKYPQSWCRACRKAGSKIK